MSLNGIKGKYNINQKCYNAFRKEKKQMSETLKERKELDPRYMWDLSTLFADDNAFETALAGIDSEIRKITVYRGILNSAANIRKYLDTVNEVSLKVMNLYSYGFLRKTEDTRDTKALEMFSRAYGAVVRLDTAASFAEPEILSNDDKSLKEFEEAEVLSDYRYYMKNLIDGKCHMLSEKEEALLASYGEVLNTPEQAMTALLNADMEFAPALDQDGKSHEVNASNYILLQSSNDRVLRENAFHSYYRSFSGHINTLSTLFSGFVKSAVTEARLRGYASSRAMRMESDHIPVSVYDNLIDTVHKRMDLMHRYIKLRKRLLKLDEVHYYDVYAPLVKGNDEKYSYEEAQQMVLDAVKPLGEEYVQRVKDAYRDRWIDVYPNKGKEGGAFSEGTYTSNPFIKLNYTGTLDSVSTLAHEMGHSQHTWLTNHHQPYHYSQYTMFVAEVASTVNENLLIDQLLQKENDPKRRLVLLNQYLEGFKGTVYRQTMFAEFEKEAHAMVESGHSITPDALNELYEKLIRLYFGDELVMDEEVKYEWARIPHFYYLFYVYVYATGYCSACAISENILSGRKDAVKDYLEFLSMGGSTYPLEELKHAGVDLTTPEPIDIALNKFEKVLQDAEDTAERLGL